MTPADIKAAEAVCRTKFDGWCACATYGLPGKCQDMADTVSAVLSAYGLDRAKANGLAEGRMRTKRAGKKEQNRE